MNLSRQEGEYDHETASFYDRFWPHNVPRLEETKRYMLSTIVEGHASHALDAGCGHGLCSVVLSEFCDRVTSIDLSAACIETASKNANALNRSNIRFLKEDLQNISNTREFDLIWCWGVAMMAPRPDLVLKNLMRAASPGGTVYVGLYKKTALSWMHEIIRHFCRRFMNTPARKRLVLKGFAKLTMLLSGFAGKSYNLRADNVSIEAQVDDWYYPPFKTFYSISEIVQLFQSNGFRAECVQSRVGRLNSATIFVVRAVKQA